MGQIPWAPAHPHLPLISYHLHRKSLQFAHQERHSLCKWNLGLNLIWSATQWLSHDLWICSVITKDQVSSQDLLERVLLDDQAKVLCTRQLKCHGYVERSDFWLKKIQKLIPTWGRGRGPKENLDRSDQHGLPDARPNWDPPFRQESWEW